MANQQLVKTPGSALVSSLKSHLGQTNVSGQGTILLLDTSASMASYTDGGIKRIEALQRALRAIGKVQDESIKFQFNTRVARIESLRDDITPNGGTDLTSALVTAKNFNPKNVIVFTDGEPDSEYHALGAAAQLNCPINTVFVGDPNNSDAIDFCRRLAAQNKGKFISNPLQSKTIGLFPEEVKRLMLSAATAPEDNKPIIMGGAPGYAG